MKIAVNTRLLLKDKLEGIGWFSYETLKRITQQHPECQFYFIFDRPFDDSFIFSNNIEPVVAFPQARHPFLYYLWFEYSIPWVLRKVKPDLFFSPDGYLSLSTGTRSMNVFHDLNFEHHPEDLPLLERKYYRYFFPKYAHKACRIATVSEFSKHDIVEQYHVDPEKIDVVYNGMNEQFKPVDEPTRIRIQQKYSDGKPFFVFVGALHPRKNLANLFKAYDDYRKSSDSNVQLVIVGKKKWWTEKIREAYEEMQFKDDVRFIGRLEAGELQEVIASALAMTYVSYFEGFGIPIVEAFRCETAVITSNITSMPEVAADAAILVDPFSISSISEALRKITFDERLRKELIARGKVRSHDFSWQKSADRLWISMEKALSGTKDKNIEY